MKQAAWLQDRRMQKFRDVLSRWESRSLSGMEAAEILGCSERQFRRYRVRYEDEGLDGLIDRRLGKASARRVPVDEIAWMVDQYRTRYAGWNVKHFHEHLVRDHGFRWGLYLDQNAAAYRRVGGTGQATRGAPPQAAEEAVRGDDAASGREPPRLARRAARV